MTGSMKRVAIILVPTVLIAALSVFLFRVQDEGRTHLEERYANRVELGSRFIAAFIDDWRKREEIVAVSQLSGPIDHATFRTIMEPFGFEAAVLLDASGALLAVHPERSDIIGQPIGDSYAHLTVALSGRSNVSGVVPSAARQIPVVAIAVPFHSSDGLRVFSGAVSVDEGPLGQFMDDMLPFRSVEVYLVDQKELLVAATGAPLRLFDELSERDAALTRAISGQDNGQGEYERDGEEARYVVQRVPGTPWRVVASVPSEVLYEPVAHTRALPWLILAGLIAAAISAVYLLIRLQRSRDELDSRLTEQVRLNAALDDFSARVAHDLRSPIATISTGIATLNERELPPDIAERILQGAKIDADRAIALIDDLLDLARASGTPRRKKVDLGELFSDVRKQVPDLDMSIGEIPDSVEVDPTSFRQAALNLARNAAKYAKGNGKASLVVAGRQTREGTVLSFADRGPGLPAGEGDRLFQAFERGEGRKEPGTGLGLAIVGAMAKAHGGRVWYEDQPGGGAIFKILIPPGGEAPSGRLVGRQG